MQRDFVGFSFDGIHSSELGILRVSEGDRYEETLHPEMEDLKTEIPGLDGNYYFNSDFKTRSIQISIAFDSMTELQFRKLRRLFGMKKNCELIFDERPYKVYMAKVAKPIDLKYVCFDEQKKHIDTSGNASGVRWVTESHEEEVIDEETSEPTGETTIVTERTREKIYPYVLDDGIQRIYKGEGSIEFICYYPFARQLFKTLDQYQNINLGTTNLITTYENVDEWAESSGLLWQSTYNQYNIDKIIPYEIDASNFNYEIPVYNPGDIKTGFYLYIPFVKDMIIPKIGNYIKIYGDNNGLLLRPISTKKSSAETGILINTVDHLIEGVSYDPIVASTNRRRRKPWIRSGNLYNEFIAAGDFPYIERSDWFFDINQFKQAIYLNCDLEYEDENEGTMADKSNEVAIHYDYLYL